MLTFRTTYADDHGVTFRTTECIDDMEHDAIAGHIQIVRPTDPDYRS